MFLVFTLLEISFSFLCHNSGVYIDQRGRKVLVDIFGFILDPVNDIYFAQSSIQIII
jgi:hypothetical protein